MLIKYKKDFEKITMGLLSYLPDFKNFKNLKDEIKLCEDDNDFVLFLYRNSEGNVVGVVGCQETENFIVIRYLSLAPGFREDKYQEQIMQELTELNHHKKVTTLPEYSYLLKLRNKHGNK